MTTRRQEILEEPWRADILSLLRQLERDAKGLPRIGTSAVLAQDIVALGQDPFIAFPDSNVTQVEEREARPLRVRTRFLGHFGPQGALPLSTTMEAYHWHQANDDSFTAFADIFANRFLQLFFRVWSDARPITQSDRPDDDRFRDYVGSFIGIGSEAFHDRDSVPDSAKLPYAGLISGRVKSAARLRQVLEGVLGIEVEVVERVGCWLDFEPSDFSQVGRSGANLGQNTYLGARVFSIENKARCGSRPPGLRITKASCPAGGGSGTGRHHPIVSGRCDRFRRAIGPAPERGPASCSGQGRAAWLDIVVGAAKRPR